MQAHDARGLALTGRRTGPHWARSSGLATNFCSRSFCDLLGAAQWSCLAPFLALSWLLLDRRCFERFRLSRLCFHRAKCLVQVRGSSSGKYRGTPRVMTFCAESRGGASRSGARCVISVKLSLENALVDWQAFAHVLALAAQAAGSAQVDALSRSLPHLSAGRDSRIVLGRFFFSRITCKFEQAQTPPASIALRRAGKLRGVFEQGVVAGERHDTLCLIRGKSTLVHRSTLSCLPKWASTTAACRTIRSTLPKFLARDRGLNGGFRRPPCQVVGWRRPRRIALRHSRGLRSGEDAWRDGCIERA